MFDFISFLGGFIPLLVSFLSSSVCFPFVGLGILTVVVGIVRDFCG